MRGSTPHGGRERLHEIDLLRFVAAMLVVFYHFTFFGPAAGLSPLSFDAISTVSRYGGLGVNLFFIISGFVILMSAQDSTPAQFLVSRVVRLYPAYWACCTVTYLGLQALPHPSFSVSLGQYVANLPMIGAIGGVPYVDGVYWSLLVELRFYFVVFVLLASGLLAHMRWLLGAWLAISLLAHHDIAETRATNWLLLSDWSGYFIAGAMCFLVRQRRRWDWYSVAVLAASCVLVVDRAREAAAVETRQLGVGMDPTVLTAVLIGFFVVFALIASDRTAWLRRPGFVVVGSLTYPLYLLHQRLGYTLFEALGRQVNRYLLLGAVIGAMTTAAHIVCRHVEQPLAGRLRPLLDGAVTRVARLAAR